MKNVSVFCGSSPGAEPAFASAARDLGREFLRRGLGLVYGGGRVGLMYEIARTIHEGAGLGVGELRIVETMHERKALMAGLSDGFIALPGGLGTMEEFFEVVTWAQLGIHRKPCGFLNVAGYFDPILGFLVRAEALKFLQPEHRAMILSDPDPARLLDLFETYRPPEADMARWALDMSKT